MGASGEVINARYIWEVATLVCWRPFILDSPGATSFRDELARLCQLALTIHNQRTTQYRPTSGSESLQHYAAALRGQSLVRAITCQDVLHHRR